MAAGNIPYTAFEFENIIHFHLESVRVARGRSNADAISHRLRSAKYTGSEVLTKYITPEVAEMVNPPLHWPPAAGVGGFKIVERFLSRM